MFRKSLLQKHRILPCSLFFLNPAYISLLFACGECRQLKCKVLLRKGVDFINRPVGKGVIMSELE